MNTYKKSQIQFMGLTHNKPTEKEVIEKVDEDIKMSSHIAQEYESLVKENKDIDKMDEFELEEFYNSLKKWEKRAKTVIK